MHCVHVCVKCFPKVLNLTLLITWQKEKNTFFLFFEKYFYLSISCIHMLFWLQFFKGSPHLTAKDFLHATGSLYGRYFACNHRFPVARYVSDTRAQNFNFLFWFLSDICFFYFYYLWNKNSQENIKGMKTFKFCENNLYMQYIIIKCLKH